MHGSLIISLRNRAPSPAPNLTAAAHWRHGSAPDLLRLHFAINRSRCAYRPSLPPVDLAANSGAGPLDPGIRSGASQDELPPPVRFVRSTTGRPAQTTSAFAAGISKPSNRVQPG